MASSSNIEIDETTTWLEKLNEHQRDYLLYRLVCDKFDDKHPLEPIPVHRPDGTLLGYIRPLIPPSAQEVLTMHDRAKTVDPRAGRPTGGLLERMRAGDVESVKKFIDS